MGLTGNISKMDVRINYLLTARIKAVAEQAQAEIYRDSVVNCFSQESFSGLTFWGFTDKHSWVHDFYYEDSPLLFDKEYQKKPSYFAVEEALKQIKSRKENNESLDDTIGRWMKWMKPEPQEDVNKNSQVTGNNKPDWQIDET